jgi:hypothetical protein
MTVMRIGDVESIKVVCRLGIQIQRQLPHIVAAIGEKRHSLGHLHFLRVEDLEGVAWAWCHSSARGRNTGGAFGRHALASDPRTTSCRALLAGMDVAAVETDRRRQVWARQRVPVALTAGGKDGLLPTELPVPALARWRAPDAALLKHAAVERTAGSRPTACTLSIGDEPGELVWCRSENWLSREKSPGEPRFSGFT